MKKVQLLLVFTFALVFALTQGVFSKTYNIMLQGFHWESSSVSYGWFNVINDNSQRIADSGFTLVWFPPVSKAADGAEQGYMPNEWYNLNSEYGNYNELTAAIWNLGQKGVKSIADIVINHRVGTTGWADFSNPYMSTYTIVKDDEWNGPKSDNYDSGDGTSYARDLDHMNPETQNAIKDWLSWLRWTVGFAGWRYDMVKGYAGWAIEMYNDYTSPEFSVGEYWDSNPLNVAGWIDSTHSDWWKRSTAFDFPLRDVLYQAVVYRNYDWLKYGGGMPGVIGVWSDKAVTFLENHDTEEARNGAYASPFPDGDLTLQGYAYILTHPGTPTVFWKDIYDSGSYYEDKIEEIIWIRKNYGIHSESPVYIAMASGGYGYAAYIQGDNGEIAIKIGPGSWSPVGSKWDPSGDLLTSGPDYAIWGEWGKWW